MTREIFQPFFLINTNQEPNTANGIVHFQQERDLKKFCRNAWGD